MSSKSQHHVPHQEDPLAITSTCLFLRTVSTLASVVSTPTLARFVVALAPRAMTDGSGPRAYVIRRNHACRCMSTDAAFITGIRRGPTPKELQFLMARQVVLGKPVRDRTPRGRRVESYEKRLSKQAGAKPDLARRHKYAGRRPYCRLSAFYRGW